MSSSYIVLSEEIKERYGENTRLNHEMSGSFYEIFSRVMKVFVGKKVTIPGSFKRYVGIYFYLIIFLKPMINHT